MLQLEFPYRWGCGSRGYSLRGLLPPQIQPIEPSIFFAILLDPTSRNHRQQPKSASPH